MQPDELAEYRKFCRVRSSRKASRGGLIGVSVFYSTYGTIFFVAVPPNCQEIRRKNFRTAVEAAQFYNTVVNQTFGKFAVTCDLMAAQRLDEQYAKFRKHLS